MHCLCIVHQNEKYKVYWSSHHRCLCWFVPTTGTPFIHFVKRVARIFKGKFDLFRDAKFKLRVQTDRRNDSWAIMRQDTVRLGFMLTQFHKIYWPNSCLSASNICGMKDFGCGHEMIVRLRQWWAGHSWQWQWQCFSLGCWHVLCRASRI